jgi:predicted ATPase
VRRSPTQPPRLLDRIIGRDAELDALDAEILRSRLVTVQGPPGVGKTRLANEIMRRRAARGEPVAYCDVTECATRADVIVRVAGALGVATTAVGEQLAARPLVLVIDNAEQVAAEVAACVEPWLASAPDLHVVVTTRIRLRAAGEVVFDVTPLDEAAASELFVERARAVRRELGDRDHDAIRELVRTLDGMPLAIELAAARARIYEPAQLLAKLGKSVELLHAQSSRSLEAALELSYGLLSPVEQRALAQASVFRGGFTVEAAEAVLDVDGVADALEALVDHSLVWTRRVGTRRRLGLYLVVREFAAARLAEADAVRARHAAYFSRAGAGWLADIIGPNGPDAATTIAAEAENLLAVYRDSLAARDGRALDVALVLDPVLVTRGPIDHDIAILEQALAMFPDHPQRLTALESRANALRYARLADARAAYEQLEREARAAGSQHYVARALSGIGIVKFYYRDESGESEVLIALATQRTIGDRFGQSISLASLGHLALYRNDLAVAREHFGAALAICVELRDPRNEAFQQGNLGLVEQECGRLVVARTAFERAIDVFRTVGDRRGEAWALANLASVAQEQGQLDEARALSRDALARHEEVGNRRSLGMTIAQLARIEHWDANLERARELYQQALALLENAGSAPHHALIASGHAAVLADLGTIDAAQLAFARAADVLAAAADHTGLAALEVARGHLDLARGDADAAARRLVEGLADIDRRAVRFARVGLERALARAGHDARRHRAATPTDAALVIGPSARWFCAHGGPRVDLSRRRQLRLILALLGGERGAHPGRPLGVDALLAGGWPGEVVLPEAGASRVYVAVSTLRRMGLRDLLVRVDDGYMLDPDVAVVTE